MIKNVASFSRFTLILVMLLAITAAKTGTTIYNSTEAVAIEYSLDFPDRVWGTPLPTKQIPITALSSTPYADLNPQIYDHFVTWMSYDGNDYEIYYSDGVYTHQITNNSYDDIGPQIHKSTHTWRGCPSGTDEIFLFNGSHPYQITDTGYDSEIPRIHNGQIVWQESSGGDYEIYFFNGNYTTMLTNNSVDDMYPQIHNGKITWQGIVGGDYEIFLCNTTPIHQEFLPVQITNNSYDDILPQIHNDMIVWEGHFGGGREIFSWAANTGVYMRTHNDNNYSPQIWDGEITWHHFDGNDDEIFYDNGTHIDQLTHNTFNDMNPRIHNSYITWVGNESGNDGEVFLYVGGITAQITNNTQDDDAPQIYNGQIAWHGFDGSDYETFFFEDLVPPTWVEEPMDQTIIQGTHFRYDLNATDTFGLSAWWINDTTKFAIDSQGVVTNATTLTTNLYYLEVAVSDNYQNNATGLFGIRVRIEWPQPIQGLLAVTIVVGSAAAVGIGLYTHRRRR